MRNRESIVGKGSEMGKLFQLDSPIVVFFTKTGELILLDICWLIGCIPIVTIGTSCTALYYAVAKSIRRDTGYPVQEFFRSYKSNLKRGTAASVLFLLLGFALYFNREVAANTIAAAGIAGVVVYDGILAVLAGILLYLFPVLSRFSFRLAEGLKLSFVMVIRFLPVTAVILAGTVIVFRVWAYYLPIPLILVLPAAWCYLLSFFMEKALLKFMPKPEEGSNEWYYN